MGSVYFSRQNLANLLTWELYLFSVPTLHEGVQDRISRVSLDNDLLSAKILTYEPPACSSFSTLDVPGWVFVVIQGVIS